MPTRVHGSETFEVEVKAADISDAALAFEAALAAEIEALLARQEKVVLARLQGPKARKGTRHWKADPAQSASGQATARDAAVAAGAAAAVGSTPVPIVAAGAAGTAVVFTEPVAAAALATATAHSLDTGYLLDAAKWAQEVANVVTPIIGRIVEAAQASMAARTGERYGPNTAMELSQLITPFVTKTIGIVGGHFRRVQQTIADEDAAGEPLAKIVTSVRAAYASRRDFARHAAGAVAVGAYNSAQLDAAHRNPNVVQKAWVSRRDEKVRETHREADGQVRSVLDDFIVGGSPMRYPGDPAAPLSEIINCFPADTVVEGAIVGAYRYWYEGPMVRVTMESGRVLSATPNHPMLSDRGWVGLGSLDVGDHLCDASGLDVLGSGYPHVERVPALIGEVFDSLAMARDSYRVAGADVDFHGDRPDGDVDVVRADGVLWLGAEALLAKQLEQSLLARAGEAARPLVVQGAGTKGLHGVDLSTASLVRSGGQQGPLLWRQERHALSHGGAAVTDLDTSLNEPWADGGSADAEMLRDRLLGLSGQVALDQVVNVEVEAFAGHVFNLETIAGWYTSNGYVAQNCRCVMVFRIHSKHPARVFTAPGVARISTSPVLQQQQDTKGWHSVGTKGIGHDVSNELRGEHGRWARSLVDLIPHDHPNRSWIEEQAARATADERRAQPKGRGKGRRDRLLTSLATMAPAAPSQGTLFDAPAQKPGPVQRLPLPRIEAVSQMAMQNGLSFGQAEQVVETHDVYDVEGVTVAIFRLPEDKLSQVKPEFVALIRAEHAQNAAAMLDQVAVLQRSAPLDDMGTMVYLSPGPFATFSFSQNTVKGFHSPAARMLAVSPAMPNEQQWAEQTTDPGNGLGAWLMPTAQKAWPPVRWYVTHEWGHAVGYDFSVVDKLAEDVATEAEVAQFKKYGKIVSDALTKVAKDEGVSELAIQRRYLGQYGRSSRAEAFAEAFAAWHLATERPNPLVLAIGEAAGWEIPTP